MVCAHNKLTANTHQIQTWIMNPVKSGAKQVICCWGAAGAC